MMDKLLAPSLSIEIYIWSNDNAIKAKSFPGTAGTIKMFDNQTRALAARLSPAFPTGVGAWLQMASAFISD